MLIFLYYYFFFIIIIIISLTSLSLSKLLVKRKRPADALDVEENASTNVSVEENASINVSVEENASTNVSVEENASTNVSVEENASTNKTPNGPKCIVGDVSTIRKEDSAYTKNLLDETAVTQLKSIPFNEDTSNEDTSNEDTSNERSAQIYIKANTNGITFDRSYSIIHLCFLYVIFDFFTRFFLQFFLYIF